MPVRKYVLDSNCFVDASRDEGRRAAFTQFCEAAAPGLYLSSVVAAELMAGMRDADARRRLEASVIEAYARRGRIVTPSERSWAAVGRVLSSLAEREELEVARAPRSFVFDVLIAQSCREIGATLVSGNARDMSRIAALTPFEFVAPYPVYSNRTQ